MENSIEKKNYIASQYRVASISYGLFFCLIGTVLNTIEPFKTCSKCENSLKIFIECFYIFMYTLSIIWMIVMFILIIIAKRQQKVSIKNPTGLNRRLSSAHKNTHFLIRKKGSKKILEKFKNSDSTKANILQNQDDPTALLSIQDNHHGHHNTSQAIISNSASTANLSRVSSFADVSKFHFTYDYENGTGELYMRCGTAIFSLCSMIDRCLSLIQMTEIYLNKTDSIYECKITLIVSMVAKSLSLIFIFMQSFFIFKYANIIINYGKNSAAIGLMHIVCTNFCVSFRTIVYETVSEIRHHNAHVSSSHKSSSSIISSSSLTYASNGTLAYIGKISDNLKTNNLTSVKIKQLGCINILSTSTDISVGIRDAQEQLAPYLYPCIIEYSLMSMTVFFILWESIEQRYNFSNSNTYNHNNSNNNNNHLSKEKKQFLKPIESSSCLAIRSDNNIHQIHSNMHEIRHANQFTVDCGKTTTGLFFGMFVLLLTIISLITYFIYKNTNEHKAIEISEITELFLISLSIIVVVTTFVKLKCCKFSQKPTFEMSYNEILIVVGLAGIYLFCFYSIIAILNNGVSSFIDTLSLLIQIVSIIESTFQSILIINGLKMFTKSTAIKKKKPGRSLITLLILIDVSLWLSETFSIKKYDMNTIQLDYYDIVFWSIASSISSPLAIFFRFHSSVCLSDMWKTLYE